MSSTVVPWPTSASIRLPQPDAAAEVETCRRLVEEDDGRPGDERGGEVELAAHAAGVGAHEPVAGLGEVERREQLAGTVARGGAAEVVEAADHLEVLEAGQVLVDGRVLAREPDPLANPGPLPQDVEAGNPRAPAVRAKQRGQDPDGGGLARPVRSEQTEHAAGLDAEVDAGEGFDLAVALAQILCLDGGFARHVRQATGGGRVE